MNFAAVFKISIQHDYHTDNSGRGLELVPTAETQRRLARCGWLFREQGGQYTLAAETENGTPALRVQPLPLHCLRFWLVVRDALFYNYTNLPATAVKNRLYFSNGHSTTSNALLLHPASEADEQVVLVAGDKQLTLETPDSGTLYLRDAAGTVLVEGAATAPKTTLTLPASEEGWCQIDYNGTLLPPVIVSNPPMGLPVKGLVEIWHDATKTGIENWVRPDGSAAGHEYVIHFGARSIYWTYLLTGAALENYQQLAITDARRSLFFDGPQPITLINGTAALSFTSPEPMRLQENSSTVFQLRRNCQPEGAAGTPVIDRLPRPKPDLLHGAGNRQYSEIIVHL